MALLEMIQEKAFLGAEFATFLWHRSETSDGVMDLGGGKNCEVRFERDLVLAGPPGEAESSALRGEAPSLAPEAAAALAAGKKVKRARVRLATTDNVAYEFTLNAETFDWSGLKIVTPPSLPFEEAVPLRLRALEEFYAIFEQLYGAFLDLRLDEDAWKGETRRMKKWIVRKVAGGEEPEPSA